MSSNSNNSQIERMRTLITYGLVNESAKNKKGVSGNIEYTAKGADGKSYAIIRECAKYYIKSAPAGANAMLAENYDYLGGYMDRKAHEYGSYNQAMKNFEMKMTSLNEAYGSKVSTDYTDPSRKPDMIKESTEAMSADLRRIRDIMRNAQAINEGKECVYCTGGKEDREDEIKKTSEKPVNSGEPFSEPAKAEMEKPVSQTSEKPEESGAPFDEKAEVKKVQQVAESCELKEDDDKDEDEAPEITSDDDIPEVSVDPEGSDDDTDAEDDTKDIDADGDDSDDKLEADTESENEDSDDDDLDSLNSESEEDSKEDSETIADLLARISALESKVAELEGDEELDDEDEDELKSDTDDKDANPEVEVDEYDTFDEMPDDLKESLEPMMKQVVKEARMEFYGKRKTVKEDQMREFGNHPGYRKQPMSVPSNVDMSRDTKDFDDKSVANTKPFGSSIGDGFPYREKYNRLVDNTTERVMEALRKTLKK